jgi:glycosyltransferase involved in cell wall biosynthesis
MNMLMPNSIQSGTGVLVVAPQPFYEDRGTPIAIRHVLEALSVSGQKVDLLTFPAGSGVSLPGMRIFRVGRWTGIKHIPIGFSFRKLLLDVLLCFALFRMLHRSDYWCVHAVEEMVFPALIIAKLRRIPVIYDMQSCLPDQLREHPVFGLGWVQRWLVRCERWAFRRASIVVGSAGLEPYVKRAEPATPIREWVFPGQVNFASDEEVAARRTECGVPAKAPIILYSGNFARYQGVNYLVEAIPEVLKSVPSAVFVLVGADGQGIPADLREAIERVPAGALKILPRQPREALPSFIAMADILVSPRAGGDNLPLKVFDYIAAGKPIVATDYPIHRTILNEERAVLVEPDAHAMAQGLITLLQDETFARKLGAAAREHSEAFYGLSAFQRLVNEIYWHVGREQQAAAEHA